MDNKTPRLRIKGILNNRNNEILFIKEVEEDVSQIIKLPDVIIRYGETPESALKRGLLETTDIEVEPLSLLGIYSKMELNKGDIKHVITVVFICLILDVRNLVNQANSLWLNKFKQTTMPVIEEDKRILRDYALWRIDKSTYWTTKLF